MALRCSVVACQRAKVVTKRLISHRASFSTYYDSQSGLHLPVHNEKEVSIFLNKSGESTSPDSFIPAQFYKEDASSDVPDKLEALVNLGVSGLWLPQMQFPRDLRNLQTLHNVAPPNFKFFANSSLTIPTPIESASVIFEFLARGENAELQEKLGELVGTGMHTTLLLGHDVCSTMEPISVANQIATLIDATGGCQVLLISPPTDLDEDDVLAICEELMYLDVAGPTIKSRIIVDTTKEEVIEETMLVGINKFVVNDESQVDMVADIAKWQGKTIVQC